MTYTHVLRLAGAIRAKGHTMNEAALAAEWKAVDAAKESAENVMQDAVALVLETYAERAAHGIAFESKAAPGEPVLPVVASIIDLDALWAALAPVLSRTALTALRAGWATGLARVSASLPFDAERAVVRDAVAKILDDAESIPLTFRSRVDTVIRGGLAEGLTGEQLAGRVRAAAPDLTAKQAKTVARTAGTAAFEAGQVDSFKEAGIESKRWLSMRDDRVRSEHQALDGDEVPIDGVFSNGLEYPQEPNCRCTILPISTPKTLTYVERRNAEMRTVYQQIKHQYPTWVQAVEAVQDTVEGANALSFTSARKICHSAG